MVGACGGRRQGRLAGPRDRGGPPGPAPSFDDPDEAAIYEYSRQLQEAGQVSEDIYQRVLDRWDVVGIVELTALLGYYAMVAMTLNAHLIPLPDGAEPLLPKLPGDRSRDGAGGEPASTTTPDGMSAKGPGTS